MYNSLKLVEMKIEIVGHVKVISESQDRPFKAKNTKSVKDGQLGTISICILFTTASDSHPKDLDRIKQANNNSHWTGPYINNTGHF